MTEQRSTFTGKDLDRVLYDAWQKRDLSARRYVYVWADGVYLQARMEENAECMLVLIGATPEGKKELVGFQTGVRESAQSWRELLIDIKRRGLEIAPDLAVGDGALGFWKAIEEIFPGTRHQRVLGSQDRQRARRLPLACKFFGFSYLFWAHALRDKVSVPLRIFGSLLRRQVEPHVRTDIVTGKALAVRIHQPDGVLSERQTLVGCEAIPFRGLDVILRHA
jgi:hypothetical protein